MASSSDSDSDDPPRPAIFDAIYAFDAEALRRELAAGVDPNMRDYDSEATPLYYAAFWRALRAEEQLQERLECIAVLLEAGASVDKLVSRSCGGTACLLYTSPSPRDATLSRMPSSA